MPNDEEYSRQCRELEDPVKQREMMSLFKKAEREDLIASLAKERKAE